MGLCGDGSLSRELQPAGMRVDPVSMRRAPSRSWKLVGTAAAVLVAAGWGHRALLARVDSALNQVVGPSRPLATLPLVVGEWVGRDVEVDPRVLKAPHFDDQFVNRTYVSARASKQVEMFVGYVGRPRARLGHRPDICQVAHGLSEVHRTPLDVMAPGGHSVPATLYEFEKPEEPTPRTLVLATYIVNGHYVSDPTEPDRWNARSPLLFGERAAYLMRIQLSISCSADRAADVSALQQLMAGLATSAAAIVPYWDQ